MPNNQTTTCKPANIPWLGDIPSDWEVRRLKFVFNYVTGATPDSGKNSYYSDEGFNWITISDLNGKYTKESKNKITQEGVEKKNMTIVPTGSLLYSFKLSVGQMSFVEVPTYTNEAIFAILPEPNLNLDFWYYALESYLIKSANENIYGAKIFNQDSIDNAQLVCPPVETQQDIANYLDTKCDLIAKYIADKTKIIELLKEQKKSLIYNAVTKGLDPNSKLKPSGVEWLGDIPSDWEVIKLKYLGKIENGSTPSSSEESYWDGDIDWITPTDLGKTEDPNIYVSKRKITQLGLENCGTTIVPKNSIIISCRAPIGSIGIATKEMCTNQGCKSFISNSKVNFEFVYYHFISFNEYLQSLGRGTTFQELATSDFADSNFILPPLQTQQQIMTYLDTQTAIIDDTISKIQREIGLIHEYKKSLIYNAVTGKILI